MVNIKSELSELTTIGESTFTKLFDKMIWCISNGVEDSILTENNSCEVDIGIGTLIINISDDSIKYKFIPSQKLEKALIDTVINEKNSLVLNIEDSLITKL